MCLVFNLCDAIALSSSLWLSVCRMLWNGFPLAFVVLWIESIRCTKKFTPDYLGSCCYVQCIRGLHGRMFHGRAKAFVKHEDNYIPVSAVRSQGLERPHWGFCECVFHLWVPPSILFVEQTHVGRFENWECALDVPEAFNIWHDFCKNKVRGTASWVVRICFACLRHQSM